jgi:NTP pyrophosphatase (non-canonical NTP hydrolase)
MPSELSLMIVRELQRRKVRSYAQIRQALEALEPKIVSSIVVEALGEIIEWIEHQDKLDALQIYIRIKKLIEEEDGEEHG